MIRTRQTVEQIARQARAEGFVTLLDAGIELVLSGLTTLSEVHRTIGNGQVTQSSGRTGPPTVRPCE